jgi:glycosyltransferase involved in cell wall biosynthesis
MSPADKLIINGRFLDQATTGVQRYAFGISCAIDQMIGEGHPAVAALRIVIARPSRNGAPFPFRHLTEKRVGRLGGHGWEQVELPFYSKAAPLLNLCNVSPLLGRNNLTVVHDANVWLAPDNYSRAFRAVYHALLPAGIRRSRVWVTVSKYSAGQLLALQVADRPPDAIIGSGSDHILAQDWTRSRFARPEPRKPFVFALGSRSRAKNIDLVRSLAPELGAKGIRIVVAGDVNTRVFGERGECAGDNVVDLGRVSDDDLAYLLCNCLCFLFPSYTEGFGIPPLEAMAMGAPVISSNAASMPEVLGDAALYCRPDQRSAWIATVLRLNDDADLRAELMERGRAQAAKYTWKASALRLLDLARQMLPPK